MEAHGGGPCLLETRISNHNFPLFCGGCVEGAWEVRDGACGMRGGALVVHGGAWRLHRKRVGGAQMRVVVGLLPQGTTVNINTI